MVVCICKIIEFFVEIRPKFLNDAKVFIEIRKELAEKT